ncbi:12753_t:CDS:2 [Ambispora gerdemannii]|uniref:12753_t:CDS:1 n=1 Tax=Ambispora gerdemannii TaxID=144530 RepID=A0A9N8VQ98_9GLOM|nr:12753_t:CDS:2 [Ambispora gerdemannii]
MGKRSSPPLHIKLPERPNFFNHMSKGKDTKNKQTKDIEYSIEMVKEALYKNKLRLHKYPSKKPKIVIPNLLLDGSPLPSPTKSEETFEKELNRARKEFKQFNQDLDEISRSVEKLVQEAPEWFAGIEEIKKKQDNVEECITATQEKIIENEHRLEKLETLQYEANDDINNDLKKIQEQLNELLEKHRTAHANVQNLDRNQLRTTEQLDLMLHAIHEYARLIEECSTTIKHFDDVGSPIKYESLDLSPFRRVEGSSYFEDHIYRASRATTPNGSLPTSRSTSPIFFTHSGTSTPAITSSQSADPSSPLSPTGPPATSPQPIHPLPYYQLRHQQLLLLGMRRAAVGLKFLLYAKQLNDLKNGHPEIDCDLDVDLFGDSMDECSLSSYATYTKTAVFNSKDSDYSSSDTDGAKTSSDDCINSSGGNSENNNYSNYHGEGGKVSVTIRKRPHVFFVGAFEWYPEKKHMDFG